MSLYEQGPEGTDLRKLKRLSEGDCWRKSEPDGGSHGKGGQNRVIFGKSSRSDYQRFPTEREELLSLGILGARRKRSNWRRGSGTSSKLGKEWD